MSAKFRILGACNDEPVETKRVCRKSWAQMPTESVETVTKVVKMSPGNLLEMIPADPCCRTSSTLWFVRIRASFVVCHVSGTSSSVIILAAKTATLKCPVWRSVATSDVVLCVVCIFASAAIRMILEASRFWTVCACGWCGGWRYWHDNGLVIHSSLVRVMVGQHRIMALDKLLTPVCLCHQAV